MLTKNGKLFEEITFRNFFRVCLKALHTSETVTETNFFQILHANFRPSNVSPLAKYYHATANLIVGGTAVRYFVSIRQILVPVSCINTSKSAILKMILNPTPLELLSRENFISTNKYFNLYEFLTAS